jgi:hypothetical protein
VRTDANPYEAYYQSPSGRPQVYDRGNIFNPLGVIPDNNGTGPLHPVPGQHPGLAEGGAVQQSNRFRLSPEIPQQESAYQVTRPSVGYTDRSLRSNQQAAGNSNVVSSGSQEQPPTVPQYDSSTPPAAFPQRSGAGAGNLAQLAGLQAPQPQGFAQNFRGAQQASDPTQQAMSNPLGSSGNQLQAQVQHLQQLLSGGAINDPMLIGMLQQQLATKLRELQQGAGQQQGQPPQGQPSWVNDITGGGQHTDLHQGGMGWGSEFFNRLIQGAGQVGGNMNGANERGESLGGNAYPGYVGLGGHPGLQNTASGYQTSGLSAPVITALPGSAANPLPETPKPPHDPLYGYEIPGPGGINVPGQTGGGQQAATPIGSVPGVSWVGTTPDGGWIDDAGNIWTQGPDGQWRPTGSTPQQPQQPNHPWGNWFDQNRPPWTPRPPSGQATGSVNGMPAHQGPDGVVWVWSDDSNGMNEGWAPYPGLPPSLFQPYSPGLAEGGAVSKGGRALQGKRRIRQSKGKGNDPESARRVGERNVVKNGKRRTVGGRFDSEQQVDKGKRRNQADGNSQGFGGDQPRRPKPKGRQQTRPRAADGAVTEQRRLDGGGSLVPPGKIRVGDLPPGQTSGTNEELVLYEEGPGYGRWEIVGERGEEGADVEDGDVVIPMSDLPDYAQTLAGAPMPPDAGPMPPPMGAPPMAGPPMGGPPMGAPGMIPPMGPPAGAPPMGPGGPGGMPPFGPPEDEFTPAMSLGGVISQTESGLTKANKAYQKTEAFNTLRNRRTAWRNYQGDKTSPEGQGVKARWLGARNEAFATPEYQAVQAARKGVTGLNRWRTGIAAIDAANPGEWLNDAAPPEGWGFHLGGFVTGDNVYSPEDLANMPVVQKLRGDWRGMQDIGTGNQVASAKYLGLKNLPTEINIANWNQLSENEKGLVQSMYSQGLQWDWNDIVQRGINRAPMGQRFGPSRYGG